MNRPPSTQLVEIVSKIAGPRPGIWIPPYNEVGRRTGVQFIVVRAYSEVIGKPRSSVEFWEDLVTTQLPPAVVALSAINILIERFAPQLDLEAALSEKFLNPSLRSHVEPHTPGPKPDYRLIFNRLGVLTALKGLIGVAKNARERESYDDHNIGVLIMRGNDFITTRKLRESDKAVEELDLANELLPIWELINPRNIAYGLARTHLLITRYMTAPDSIVSTLRDRIALNPTELRYNGVSLEDFIAITFGLYSHVQNMSPPQLLNGLIHCAIDSGTFLASTGFPQEIFNTFLRNRSISLDGLRQEITQRKPWERDHCIDMIESDVFATDFLAFRKHPIIDLENGKHLIIDIQFVAEMLFTGLFFEIFFSLDPEHREDFLSLWGRLFELYLWGLLEDFYPPQAEILRTDVKFGKGQIDALLDFGTYVVVLEFKFFLLLHDVKYSRDRDRFAQELRLKLVENEKGQPKALRQLAQAVQAIRTGKVRTALNQDKPVYPVVIVYESSLESFGINSFLNSEFQTIHTATDGDAYVRPLTVMSVQELETLLPQTAAGHVSWNEILEARFDGTRVRATSGHQALYDTMKAKSLEFESNSYLLKLFDEISKSVEARYRHQDADGADTRR